MSLEGNVQGPAVTNNNNSRAGFMLDDFFLPRSKYRGLVIAFFIHLFVALFMEGLYQVSNVLGHGVITALCSFDTYLLATKFTIPIEDNIEDESKMTTKVSKRVDRFFSRGQTMPCVSFLVNVLYALTVIMFGIACFFLTSSILSAAGTTKNKEVIPNNENEASGGADYILTDDAVVPNPDKNNNSIMDIPIELKPWAFAEQNEGLGRLSKKISATYKGSFLHANNDTLYFRGTKPHDSPGKTDLIFHQDSYPGVEILYKSLSGQVTSFPEIYEPRFFTLVDAEQETDSSLTRFCFLGVTPESWIAIYCSSPSHDTELRNVTLTNSNSHSVVLDYDTLPPTVGCDGKFWFQYVEYKHWGDRTVVYAIDYATMRFSWTTVKENKDHYRYSDHDYQSSEEFHAVPWFAFGIAVMVASVFVLVGRGIPSGAATLCFGFKNAVGVLLVYDGVGSTFWRMNILHMVNFLWVVAATRMLLMSPIPRLSLPSWCSGAMDSDNAPGIHKDVLLWGLYSGIALLMYPPDYNFDESLGLLICLVSCVVVGLILNHPVCQALGWTSSMVFTFIALFTTWSTMEMLWTLVVGGILSWGLGTLGFKLAQYRPTLVVLFRRWHALIHSQIQQRFSSTTNEGHNDQPDMTEPLNRGVA